RFRGILTYTGIVMKTFLQYEPQEITMIAQPDDWHYNGQPMMFTVANMREYGVGITIAPDAVMDDGLLDICLIPRHSLLGALKYGPEMFREQTDLIPGYISHPAKKVTITRPSPDNIHIDGTPLSAGKQIDIEVLPLSLKVVIPQE
ncbi:MAG: hypothetical protein P9M15_01265, partial [Candidatus Electryoneaceae bacterium]|nr:hypothetical protein [Candidatus Electryoneaceae bacterium]